MKKRLFSLLLAMIMLFSAFPIGAFASELDEGNTAVTEASVSAESEDTEETISVELGVIEAEPEPEVTEDETQPSTEPESTEHVHAYEATVVDPTCLDMGITLYLCDCGHSYMEQTEALGHDHVQGTCTRCGDQVAYPEKPAVVASNVKETGRISLTWGAVEGAVSYHVYRAALDGEFTLVSTTADTAYVDADGEIGKLYYYYVAVEAVFGEGTKMETGNTVYGTRGLPSPVVTAANVESTGKVCLSWDAVNGAVSYNVYRATKRDGDYTMVSSTVDTTYTDEAAEAGVIYYYEVKAVANDQNANSVNSEVVYRTCDLPAPVITGISNVETTGKVRLTWDAVEGAVSYKVYRSTRRNGTYSLMFTTSGTTYTNSSAKAGVTYYYKVKAVAENKNATSAYSEAAMRTCDLPSPVVKASNAESSGKVRLTWNAVEGAVSYKVYRSDSEDGAYSLMFTTTGTSYTNSTSEAGVIYYYKVKAVAENKNANSANSKVVYRMGDLPRPVIAEISNVESTGKVRLVWNAVEGAVSYKVYRSETKDGESELMFKTTGTTYTNSSAEAGVTYYYKVRAVAKNSSATSALSVAKMRTCDCPQPEISVAVNGSGKPRVTWEAVDGAVSYKVYRSDSMNGTYKLMYVTDGTSYSNSNAEIGVRYYYKVRAVGADTSSTSAFSNVETGKAIRNVYQYVYSSYTTSKYGTSGRNTNLALACKAINGTILAPGEEFSFNEVVGPRTEKKGYQLATVFNDIGYGRGGGVCQVATTLFNCALLGNLKISKRRQHSIAVTYVPMGRDATVYKKIKDFCFVNDSDYYIKIQAKASGGTVSISFLTRESNVAPGSKVKLRVTKSGDVYTLKRSFEGVVNYVTTSSYD